MTATMTPEGLGRGPEAGRDGFGRLVHAEWTKFRTVRGWVIGAIVSANGCCTPAARSSPRWAC